MNLNHRRLRAILIQAALIVLAGLWIYSPTYHGDWLWDDDVVLTNNPTVLSGSLAGLVKLWVNPDGLDYFPLSYSAFWLQAMVFGPQSTGYHVTSILLHIASGLLLWALLGKMKIPGAWVTAFAFTIHPVCVESVAWVAETKNTLSLALFLASCIFWVGQDDEVPGPKRERLYLCSLAFFLLAMFAKTSVVAMPVLTLLYAWWKRGTVTMQDAVRAAPMFLISIVLGIITMQYQWGRAIGVEGVPVGGIDSRIATAGMAILFYLVTIVWPVHLLPIYPRWDVDPPKAWQFLPLILIGGAAWWLWKNRATPWGRNAILAFGFFLLMIAPVLGLVDISYMRITWVADHFLYLPMIGPLALFVAAAAVWLGKRNERERTVFAAMAAGLMVFLAANSYFYAINWMDEDHLWEHTLASNHEAWQAHNRLGVRKLNRNDLDGAYYHFRNSSRIRPDLGETKNNLGVVLSKKGRIDDAIKAYEEAAQASPQILGIHFNLADAYLQVGKLTEARDYFEKLLEAQPSNAVFLHKHAIALFKLGEKEKAIAELRRVLELDPNYADARRNLDMMLGTGQSQQEAPPSDDQKP
ncbi:MAG: tetratricopeptide repeat protein [Planctomycetia bacterium]